jgi:hypothetical protein
MFARKANHFLSQTTSPSNDQSLTPEELKERLEYMTKVVYPTIYEKVKLTKKKQEDYYNSRHGMITDQFLPGTPVMVLNTTRTNKNEVRYEGPLIVLRRNRGGAYILKGKDGTEYTRPPSHLKVVSQNTIEIDPPHSYIQAQIDRIIDHRIVDGKNQYLIKWSKMPDTYNQWVEEVNINGTVKIQDYWRDKNKLKKRQEPPSSISQPVSKRTYPKIKVKFA